MVTIPDGIRKLAQSNAIPPFRAIQHIGMQARQHLDLLQKTFDTSPTPENLAVVEAAAEIVALLDLKMKVASTVLQLEQDYDSPGAEVVVARLQEIVALGGVADAQTWPDRWLSHNLVWPLLQEGEGEVTVTQFVEPYLKSIWAWEDPGLPLTTSIVT